VHKFFIAIPVVLVTAGVTISSSAQVPEKGNHVERALGAEAPNGRKKIPVKPEKPKRETPAAGASAGAPTPSSPPNAPNRVVPGGSSPAAPNKTNVPVVKERGGQSISSPSSPISQAPPSCNALQQNMNDVQNKMTLLKNFMTNVNRSISSLNQQITQLNQTLSSIQQKLQSSAQELSRLRRLQQGMNDDATALDAAGQGGLASGLRATAQAIDQVISKLQDTQSSLLLQVSDLQQQLTSLNSVVQGFIDGRNQMQAVLDQLNQEYAQDFGIYEGQCGG